MTIYLKRPDDPKLRAALDEAKRLCENRPIPIVIDDETRPIWECAKRAAAEVAAWPAWKHTEQPAPDPDCCVGDRSKCRCASKQLAMTDEDVEREKWMQVWSGDE